MIQFTQRDDLPATYEETRRLQERRATEAVPAHLAALDEKQPPEKKIYRIDRAAIRTDAVPAQLDGHAPAWLDLAFTPKQARRPAPADLRHRGKSVEPLFIYQPDDRRVYNDTRYPWGCVCRVLRPDGRGGSGVLIGPRHVLTASHCVQWNTNLAERIEVHFAGNAPSATAFTQTARAYSQIDQAEWSDVDDDYAVITLTERLGDRFGWMGSKLYDSSWDGDAVWDTVGYAGDVAGFNFPTFQRRCNLDEDELDLGAGRAIETTADATHGQSGSPFFGWWNNEPYVVSVISAEVDGENWTAGGSNLNAIISEARTLDP